MHRSSASTMKLEDLQTCQESTSVIISRFTVVSPAIPSFFSLRKINKMIKARVSRYLPALSISFFKCESLDTNELKALIFLS